MAVLQTLQRLSAAEEFFAVLDVPYEPRVLDVARLHILKRMGEYLGADELSGADDGTVHALCRAHLERAYDDFVRSSPMEQRVFKALKDAVKPAPMTASKPFVPLSTLSRVNGSRTP